MTFYASSIYYLKIGFKFLLLSILGFLLIFFSPKIYNSFSFLINYQDYSLIPIYLLYILGLIFFLLIGFTIYIDFVKGKPYIELSEEILEYRYRKYKFIEFQDFTKGKGGSESQITFKNQKKLNLELSWFSKEDRNQIENFLISKINHKK